MAKLQISTIVRLTQVLFLDLVLQVGLVILLAVVLLNLLVFVSERIHKLSTVKVLDAAYNNSIPLHLSPETIFVVVSS